jgi:hypothetical protein
VLLHFALIFRQFANEFGDFSISRNRFRWL